MERGPAPRGRPAGTQEAGEPTRGTLRTLSWTAPLTMAESTGVTELMMPWLSLAYTEKATNPETDGECPMPMVPKPWTMNRSPVCGLLGTRLHSKR